jgi:hypothetical protein
MTVSSQFPILHHLEIDPMRTMLTAFLGMGLVALLAGPAAAQGRGFGRGGSVAFLLGTESVQKELKLDDKQLEKAKELAEKTSEEMREKFQGLGDLSPEERMAKFQEINREMTASTLKAAGDFLKPEQVTRLKQISYQRRFAQAFTDPEVAKKLNLTDAQKTDIQAILADSMKEMPTREDFQDDREAAMKKSAEVSKQALSKAVAKLNDEQQKTWKELLGSPFEVIIPAN